MRLKCQYISLIMFFIINCIISESYLTYKENRQNSILDFEDSEELLDINTTLISVNLSCPEGKINIGSRNGKPRCRFKSSA